LCRHASAEDLFWDLPLALIVATARIRHHPFSKVPEHWDKQFPRLQWIYNCTEFGVHPGLTNYGGTADVPWLSENPTTGFLARDGGSRTTRLTTIHPLMSRCMLKYRT
jgi:hypothetical protein